VAHVQITERDANECFFTEEETAACVDEAHSRGVRLCSHARARDSVKQCIKHGVDVIYHGSWIDEEGMFLLFKSRVKLCADPHTGMDMLEKAETKHIVAPAINWLVATLYEAEAFGYTQEQAEKVGYGKELEVAIRGLREMHERGIVVLPGGCVMSL
jgi:imidazolonepropionase-like amidohydrolase